MQVDHVAGTEQHPNTRRVGARSATSPILVITISAASITDPAGIAEVAQTLVAIVDGGTRVVALIPAVDETTDDLLGLARAVSPHPEARELEMLLAVAGQISCALVAMAVGQLGRESISFAAPQAGVVTERCNGHVRVVGIRIQRILAALDRDQVVLVASDQGLDGDEITTFGDRGPAEATAVALAAALGVASVEACSSLARPQPRAPRVASCQRDARDCGTSTTNLPARGTTSQLSPAGASRMQPAGRTR